MPTLVHEARLALHSLARHPGFTITATLTLALGIAVNTTMFSVVHGVLLQPLGYEDPGRLVSLALTADGTEVPFAFPEIFDLRDQVQSLRRVVADKAVIGNITGGDEPERIEVRGVTGSLFPLLGVRPLLGRLFTETDEVPGIGPIGVISYGLWQRRFGGDSTVIGRPVRIDDDDYTIIGVLPPGFVHPGADPARPVDFWFPTGFSAEPFPPPTRWWRTAGALARLQPGVTLARANDELARLVRQWSVDYPANYPGGKTWALTARPLRELVVGEVRRPLTLLFGAVGLVLLVACANVAGLQLARQAGRTTEVAVRQALGASRWQIARPPLVESLVLSLGAAGLGVLGALGGVRLVQWLAPSSMPRAGDVAVDLPVLGFAGVLGVATGVAFGLAPALMSSRTRLAPGLNPARGAGPGSGGARLRSALVVAELALALLLLTGAGLMLRSFVRLHAIETGFRPDHLLTMELTVPYPNDVSRAKYIEPEPQVRFYAAVLRHIRETPGVTAAALTSNLPLSGTVPAVLFTPEGGPATTEADGPRFQLVRASDGYFGTMGIALREGREFTRDDNATALPVAIVSQATADRLWPGVSPVGKRLKPGSTTAESPWITVVGVVSDVRLSALERPSPGQVYLSSQQNSPRPVNLVMRTRGEPLALAESIRRRVREVEPDQPVYAVRSMDQILAARVEGRRFAMQCLAGFAGLAVLLAAVGLYGVVSFSIAQRQREIGVRMALGGTPAAIVRMVLASGLRLGVLGAAIGLTGVWAAGNLLRGLLYGVTSSDPLTLLLTAAGTIGVAILACLIPGWRAAGLDPLVALRQD